MKGRNKTKTGKINEELRLEVIKRGGLTGVILWAGAVIYVSLRYRTLGAAVLPWLIPILAADVLAGVFLLRIGLRNQAIGGMSALWAAFIVLFLMTFAGRILPEWIRQIIGLDFGILLVLFVGNYYYLSKMAKKMNQGRIGYTLRIDLKNKPSSKEDFLRQFEAYCEKENIDLVYEVRDVPAVVLMNGVRCEVSLDSTPGFGGADYVMKVTER